MSTYINRTGFQNNKYFKKSCYISETPKGLFPKHQSPVPTHSAEIIRVWRSSCGQRMGTGDLYVIYYEPPTQKLDAAWIWVLRVHQQVSLFIWKVAWDKLTTRPIMRNRGCRCSPCAHAARWSLFIMLYSTTHEQCRSGGWQDYFMGFFPPSSQPRFSWIGCVAWTPR